MGNVHALAHRATAISVASLSLASFIFSFLGGFNCNFISLKRMPGRLLMTPDGLEFDDGEDASFGIQCDSPFFTDNDRMWNLSQVFLYVTLALGGLITLLTWSFSVFTPPSGRIWRSISMLSALAAVLEVPLFLIFESEPCNMDINRQTCTVASGAFLTIVSITFLVVVTLWTQCVRAPDWTKETRAWRTADREVKVNEIIIPSGGGDEGTDEESMTPRDSPQSRMEEVSYNERPLPYWKIERKQVERYPLPTFDERSEDVYEQEEEPQVRRGPTQEDSAVMNKGLVKSQDGDFAVQKRSWAFWKVSETPGSSETNRKTGDGGIAPDQANALQVRETSPRRDEKAQTCPLPENDVEPYEIGEEEDIQHFEEIRKKPIEQGPKKSSVLGGRSSKKMATKEKGKGEKESIPDMTRKGSGVKNHRLFGSLGSLRKITDHHNDDNEHHSSESKSEHGRNTKFPVPGDIPWDAEDIELPPPTDVNRGASLLDGADESSDDVSVEEVNIRKGTTIGLYSITNKMGIPTRSTALVEQFNKTDDEDKHTKLTIICPDGSKEKKRLDGAALHRRNRRQNAQEDDIEHKERVPSSPRDFIITHNMPEGRKPESSRDIDREEQDLRAAERAARIRSIPKETGTCNTTGFDDLDDANYSNTAAILQDLARSESTAMD